VDAAMLVMHLQMLALTTATVARAYAVSLDVLRMIARPLEQFPGGHGETDRVPRSAI